MRILFVSDSVSPRITGAGRMSVTLLRELSTRRSRRWQIRRRFALGAADAGRSGA